MNKFCYYIKELDQCECFEQKQEDQDKPCQTINGSPMSSEEFGKNTVSEMTEFLSTNPTLLGALGISLGLGFLISKLK